KIIPRRREAYVSYDGREIKVNDFKILCEKKMCWLPSRDGQVPAGAIPAGKTASGETLYIGRVNMGGVTKVGKVHSSHKCLYVPYNGKEIMFKSYEVLVLH
ncbi:natterin-3-like, partial [Tribolium madens]